MSKTYDINKMPKLKALKNLKKCYKGLRKDFSDYVAKCLDLEEANGASDELRTSNALKRAEEEECLAAAFYSYAMKIMQQITTEEEISELEKMGKGARRAARRNYNLFQDLREDEKSARWSAEVYKERLEKIKKISN